MRGRWTDRRNWSWLPRRLRFRVFGLIDVIALWVVVAALFGGGAWWGVGTYLDHRNYCSDSHELLRTGPSGECIGVTEQLEAFGSDLDGEPGLKDAMARIVRENARAGKSPRQVSVAVVMPYTGAASGAAMSSELIRHALQGVFVAQHAYNTSPNTKDTAIRLVFANVGENLDHWEPVTSELAARAKDEHAKAPLVAAIGFPNSDKRTLGSVERLGKTGIPSVSAALSANGMENSHLFKVSPSNRQFVDALKHYVDGKGNAVNREHSFLIADSRQDDDYVFNLRRIFFEEFGQEYGINHDKVHGRVGMYQGVKGPPEGRTGVFDKAVEEMCGKDTRTVFLAGRDADLEPFLESIRDEPSCEPRYADSDPLRILRVSTGRDPRTESAKIRRIADNKNIKIVTAAAVDAPDWRRGGDQTPERFGYFVDDYYDDAAFAHERRNALNDGYAAMYHDAFVAVGQAVHEFYESEGWPVQRFDVFHQMLGGFPSDKCTHCVQAATGKFTFDDESLLTGKVGSPTGRWPVCKPVPIVTFPDEQRQGAPPLYQTDETSHSKCPDP